MVSTIIADDDTTTISRLRQNVNPAIQKKSDRNHIRKNFSSCLYDLKKKHKSLSTRIIQYLLKCFNYLLAQKPRESKWNRKGAWCSLATPFWKSWVLQWFLVSPYQWSAAKILLSAVWEATKRFTAARFSSHVMQPVEAE